MPMHIIMHYQWRSQYRRKGGRVPPWQRNICQKSGKRGTKSGKRGGKIRKKRINQEEKAKIRKVLSLCPSWQIGLAMLCWFQTSLPLAALPLCRVIIACCFRVAALSGNAALAFHRAAIAPELNRIQLSVICRGGLDTACRLVIPLRQVALAQLI